MNDTIIEKCTRAGDNGWVKGSDNLTITNQKGIRGLSESQGVIFPTVNGRTYVDVPSEMLFETPSFGVPSGFLKPIIWVS